MGTLCGQYVAPSTVMQYKYISYIYEQHITK